MLAKLLLWAQEGSLHVTHVYLAHLKRDEERRILAHADAMAWDDLEPKIREHLQAHLLQALEGAEGELNFPAHFTGEVLPVDKVTSPGYDRTRNRPSVEILEALCDLPEPTPALLIQWGNALAYKVLAAGTVRNQLLGVLRLQVVPERGAAARTLVFATLCDLEDREESYLDETRGQFQTQTLANVVKKGRVTRGVFFPCLDDDGRERADMLVYAATAASAWFAALEATYRLNPKREGQALVRMIAQLNEGAEVPHDVFQRMGHQLLPAAATGVLVEQVADSLEKAVGYGVDREGLRRKWQGSFGDPGYRVSYNALFGNSTVNLKIAAGDIQVTLPPQQLVEFRQVTVNDETFVVFRVPGRADIAVGKDLNLRIAAADLEELQQWMVGRKADKEGSRD